MSDCASPCCWLPLPRPCISGMTVVCVGSLSTLSALLERGSISFSLVPTRRTLTLQHMLILVFVEAIQSSHHVCLEARVVLLLTLATSERAWSSFLYLILCMNYNFCQPFLLETEPTLVFGGNTNIHTYIYTYIQGHNILQRERQSKFHFHLRL